MAPMMSQMTRMTEMMRLAPLYRLYGPYVMPWAYPHLTHKYPRHLVRPTFDNLALTSRGSNSQEDGQRGDPYQARTEHVESDEQRRHVQEVLRITDSAL